MKAVPVDVFLQGSYAEEISEQEDGPKGPIYIARYRKMPGCLAQGRTRTEALVTLRGTREPYIRAMHDAGANLPLPDFDSTPSVFIGGLTLTAGSTPLTPEPTEGDLVPREPELELA